VIRNHLNTIPYNPKTNFGKENHCSKQKNFKYQKLIQKRYVDKNMLVILTEVSIKYVVPNQISCCI